MIKILLPLFSSAFENRSYKYLPRQILHRNSNGKTSYFKREVQFVLPPLLDSKNGREPHKELDLVARRGVWRHTLKTTWLAFEWPFSLKKATSFYLSGLRGHLNSADVFVNIREKTPGDCLNISGFELCSKGAISLNKSSCSAHRTEAPRTSSWRLRGKLKRKNCLIMLLIWGLLFKGKSRDLVKRLGDDNRK